MGKTSLAIKYGNIFKGKSTNSHFVYRYKANELDSRFKELARDIDRLSLVRELKVKLTGLKENILFIFDACESYDQIKDYIEMIISCQDNFKILITTRGGFLLENLDPNKLAIIILDPLSTDETINFLTQNMAVTQKDSVEEIILKLGLKDSDKRPSLLHILVKTFKEREKKAKSNFVTAKKFIQQFIDSCNEALLKEIKEKDSNSLTRND